MKYSVPKLLRLSGKIVMAGLVLPFSAPTKAEVTLDGTLGPAGSLAGPNFVIPDTVGQTVGTNLFHSFGLFNINTGESATFTGPAAIDNVISRVTGGSQSFIDGLLRSEIQSANLWFINPAGVLFGQHASLDIQGSFHVSTADYLKLGDGGRFEAKNPENNVLTVAPPEAFGFLGERQPAGIAFHSSGLSVREGETLSVIGGDIEVTAGAQFRALGGRVNMASVASAGEVRLEPNGLGMDSFDRLGRIEMNQQSIIDTSGEGGGSIFIRGGQFTMDHSGVQSETQGGKNGGIVSIKAGDFQMRNEAAIVTSTRGAGDGGLIEVEADSMSLSKEATINSMSLGAGEGGPVVVRVAGHLQLKEGAGISTGPPPRGIDILKEGAGISTGLPPRGTEVQGIVDGTFDLTGNNITIKAGSLQIGGGGYISASTRGTRKGGNIEIEAENIVLEGGALEEGFQEFRSGIFANAEGETKFCGEKCGDAGNIAVTVKTGSLQLKEGAQISASTFGSGDGGNIEVEAENIVLEGGALEEGFQEFRSGLHTSVARGSTGNAGSVMVEAGRLQLKDGARISASTVGPGKGGNIAINADNLHLSDGSEIRARSFGPGAGGNINIEATDIELNGDAGIFAGNSGTGLAGQILIKALDNLRLVNGSQISVATTQADAGNITLEVGDLLHLSSGSSITTSAAEGEGSGGNIAIGSAFVVLDEGSRIIANAERGQGGNILIRILGGGALFQSPDSLVSAASGNPELSGTVVIDAPDTDIIAGFAGLPANFLDAATVLTQLCAERSGANVSSLVVRKYEVLPDSPYALRVQLPRAVSAPRTAKQSRAPRAYYAGSPLPPMLSCLGNG